MYQLRGKDVRKFFKTYPKREQEIALVLENIQYATNVANIFRTAESAGVNKIYLTGISKTPPFGKDLKKVSRGAENKIPYVYASKTLGIIPELKNSGFYPIAVELTDKSILTPSLKELIKGKEKVCFVVGNEDSGVNRTTLNACNIAVMIPMYGKNASLNVTVSVGVILFSF